MALQIQSPSCFRSMRPSKSSVSAQKLFPGFGISIALVVAAAAAAVVLLFDSFFQVKLQLGADASLLTSRRGDGLGGSHLEVPRQNAYTGSKKSTAQPQLQLQIKRQNATKKPNLQNDDSSSQRFGEYTIPQVKTTTVYIDHVRPSDDKDDQQRHFESTVQSSKKKQNIKKSQVHKFVTRTKTVVLDDQTDESETEEESKEKYISEGTTNDTQKKLSSKQEQDIKTNHTQEVEKHIDINTYKNNHSQKKSQDKKVDRRNNSTMSKLAINKGKKGTQLEDRKDQDSLTSTQQKDQNKKNKRSEEKSNVQNQDEQTSNLLEDGIKQGDEDNIRDENRKKQFKSQNVDTPDEIEEKQLTQKQSRSQNSEVKQNLNANIQAGRNADCKDGKNDIITTDENDKLHLVQKTEGKTKPGPGDGHGNQQKDTVRTGEHGENQTSKSSKMNRLTIKQGDEKDKQIETSKNTDSIKVDNNNVKNAESPDSSNLNLDVVQSPSGGSFSDSGAMVDNSSSHSQSPETSSSDTSKSHQKSCCLCGSCCIIIVLGVVVLLIIVVAVAIALGTNIIPLQSRKKKHTNKNLQTEVKIGRSSTAPGANLDQIQSPQNKGEEEFRQYETTADAEQRQSVNDISNGMEEGNSNSTQLIPLLQLEKGADDDDNETQYSYRCRVSQSSDSSIGTASTISVRSSPSV